MSTIEAYTRLNIDNSELELVKPGSALADLKLPFSTLRYSFKSGYQYGS